MPDPLYVSALTVAAIGGAARGVMVLLGFVRTFLNRKQFVTLHFGWIEVLVSVEPVILLAMALWLWQSISVSDSPSVSQMSAAIAGAGLVLWGWVVVIWTFLSWPTIFSGHGVMSGHRLVTTGAYGVVRHPIYLGGILIWVGLALAFTDVMTFALALLYVIPAYLLYLGSEEVMMLTSFGDEYREYQRRVPRLLPFAGGTKNAGE